MNMAERASLEAEMLNLRDTPCPLKPVLQFLFSRSLGGEEFVLADSSFALLPLFLHTR